MRNYYLPPEGFSLFGLEIKFYGVIMAFAMLIGVILACKLAKKRGVKPDDIYFLALLVLPLALVGGRLGYVIFSDYNYTFLEILNTKNGGMQLYGGVIGGVIGVLIYCLIKKDFKILITLFDICAPALILGQVMGRWGNFINQEAYGNIVTDPKWQWFPFAVFIEDRNAWYQATFFYESLWNTIGFVLLLLVYYKTNENGLTSATYFIWYGLGRAMIEGLRSDSLFIGNTGIRVSVLISVILVIIGMTMLIMHFVKMKKERHG